MVFNIETKFKESNVFIQFLPDVLWTVENLKVNNTKQYTCFIRGNKDEFDNVSLSILEHLFIPDEFKDKTLITSEIYDERKNFTSLKNLIIQSKDFLDSSSDDNYVWFYSDFSDKNGAVKSLIMDLEKIPICNVKNVYSLYEKKDFGTLFTIFQSNFANHFNHIPEVLIPILIQTMKELKKTGELETWCEEFSKEYKTIQYLYQYVEYCRTFRIYNEAINMISKIRQLILFDAEYRPKSYEDFQIIKYKLLYEETILYYYLGNLKKGLEKSFEYLLLPSTTPQADTVYKNLKFYIERGKKDQVESEPKPEPEPEPEFVFKNINSTELLNLKTSEIKKHKSEEYENLPEWCELSKDYFIVACFPKFIVIDLKTMECHKVFSPPVIFKFIKKIKKIRHENKKEKENNESMITLKCYMENEHEFILKLNAHNFRPFAILEPITSSETARFHYF